MINYFDKQGNYINCENLSLEEIYHRAFALGVESVPFEGKRPCGQVVPDTLQGWRYEERPQGDLISREALLKEFAARARAARNWKENALNNGDEEIVIRATATLDFLTEVKLTIEGAPTVVNEKGTTERQQGEWIKEYKDLKCSLCGKIAYSWNNHGTYIQIKSDFCPHCGADMQKGGEE